MNINTTLGKSLGSALLLSVCACGGDGRIDGAVSALSVHYAITPPNQKWELISITPKPETNRIDVAVNVTSESDVSRLISLSRMEQFAVAKLACPTKTAELTAAIGTELRIWVHLYAENKEVTASICPEFQ